MTDIKAPDRAYRHVVALTIALFLSYLTVAMSLPAVPVHVVHGLGLGNAWAAYVWASHFYRLSSRAATPAPGPT